MKIYGNAHVGLVGWTFSGSAATQRDWRTYFFTGDVPDFKALMKTLQTDSAGSGGVLRAQALTPHYENATHLVRRTSAISKNPPVSYIGNSAFIDVWDSDTSTATKVFPMAKPQEAPTWWLMYTTNTSNSNTEIGNNSPSNNPTALIFGTIAELKLYPIPEVESVIYAYKFIVDGATP